ncbi:unnamed protein product [Malus baccata var. baccata]
MPETKSRTIFSQPKYHPTGEKLSTAEMDLRESIINQNDFALGLTKQLLQTEGKQSNLVYSPLSIHVLLSLIAAGSKGPTQDQLLSILKSNSTDHLNSFATELVSVIFSDGSPSGGPQLSFANGGWVDRRLPLKPSFKQVVETSYMAALAQVDFQTNVSSQTHCPVVWIVFFDDALDQSLQFLRCD